MPGGKGREISAKCAECGDDFITYAKELNRGRGKFCGLSCAAKSSEKLEAKSGLENPNWKGGVSLDRYRYKKSFKERHPEKVAAHKAVYDAVKRGRLKRPETCSICNSECKPEAHHEDYARPLDVIWLCGDCHRGTHETVVGQ